MRLIDADALRREIHMSYADDLGICEVIDNQPTAYDAEKVIEQFRSEAQLMSETQLPHKQYKAIGTKKARAIIRKSGVNERD